MTQENYAIPNVNGYPETILVAGPGAGLQWDMPLDARYRFKILTVRFMFSTDANVSMRWVTLRYRNLATGLSWFGVVNPIPQVANLDLYYQFAVNFPAQPWWATGTAALPDSDDFTYLPLPDVELTRFDQFSSHVGGMQVGDFFSDVNIRIVRWNDESI